MRDWGRIIFWCTCLSFSMQEQVTAAITLAMEQQIQKLLVETQLDITELDNLLQPIIDTCTKDAISVCHYLAILIAVRFLRYLYLTRVRLYLRLVRIGCSTMPRLHSTVNWWPHTFATASPLRERILSSAYISYTWPMTSSITGTQPKYINTSESLYFENPVLKNVIILN